MRSPENGIKENKMGNTRHVFIKSILHIFTEKSHSKLLSHLLKKGGVVRFVQQLCLGSLY